MGALSHVSGFLVSASMGLGGGVSGEVLGGAMCVASSGRTKEKIGR